MWNLTRTCVFLMIVIPLFAVPLPAETVWGLGTPGMQAITFSKASGADQTLSVNQDRITADVTITRGSNRGIYNIAQEASYVMGTSPVGTEWAFSDLNGNPSNIRAADFAALTFSDWGSALGGAGKLAGNIQNRQGVVHLIHENIYAEIRFIAWGQGVASSGSLTYERAAPVPEPVSMSLLVLGGLALFCTGRRCR